MKQAKSRKKTVVAITVVVLLVVFLLSAYVLLRPGTAAGSKTLTVRVHHLSGQENTFTVQTDAEYLRGALEPDRIISGTESTYGLWLETVDGETADAEAQQWWGYDINGETAMYGVDQQPVTDGDVIDFTLNVGY